MNTFQLMRLITDSPQNLLTSTESAILMVMALIGDKDGKNINPGIKKLATKTKFSERTTKRALFTLIAKKVLLVSTQRKQGSNDRSCYEFNLSIFSQKVFIKPSDAATPALVTQCPQEPSDTVTPGLKEKSKTWCHSVPSASDTVSPALVTQCHPHLIQPIFEPRNNLTIVKSGADLTSGVSEKKSKKNPKQKKSWSAEILEIFEYWKEVMSHPAAKFDEQRKRKIEKALDEHGYTVEQLKKAIDGAKKSPHHRGENDTGTIYDSIDLIFRNPGKIETFISIFDTEMTPKNKNVATAPKTSFVQKNKEQVEMLNEVTEKYFPELAKYFPSNKLTHKPRQEHEINEFERLK